MWISFREIFEDDDLFRLIQNLDAVNPEANGTGATTTKKKNKKKTALKDW